MKEKTKSNLYQIVLSLYVFILLISIEGASGVNLALVRYGITFFIFYKIVLEVKNNSNDQLLNKNLLVIFMGWVVIMVVRNISDVFNSAGNYVNLKRFIGEELIIYSFPLLMFIKIDLDEIKKIFKINLLFSLIYLVISFFFFSYFVNLNAESSDFSFSTEGLIVYFPSSLIILLFTSNYHSKRVNISTIFIIVFATFVSVLIARRNKVLYFGTALLMVSYLLSFSNTILTKSNRFTNTIITGTIFILLFLFSISNIDSFSYFLERTETGFDSREDIIDEFFYDFNNTPQDWIIGRGFHGVFTSRTLSTSDTENIRDLIENGYLYSILKGGLIYVGLLFIIFLKSFFNGFIKSKNLFSKGMALLILLYLVDMMGYGLPSGSFKYMVVFLAIAVCNSPRINNMSDLDIIQKLRLK